MPRAPHAARCLARLDRIDAPVVQVWGWPGSGCVAVVEALLDRDGARALAPEDLLGPAGSGGGRSGERTLREGVRALCADGARWLVVPNLPEAAASWLPALARAVPAGRRLVFPGHRRLAPAGAASGLLTPAELLLTVEEGIALAREVLAEVRDPDAARRLVEAAGGWYRPVLLALEHAAATDAAAACLPSDPETLVALPAVAEFFRFEVLAGLDETEREALLRAVAGSPPEDAAVRRLVEDRGLVRETEEGLRPPRLLAAFLAQAARAEAARPERSGAEPDRPPTPAGGDGEGPGSGDLPVVEEPVPPPEEPRFRVHLLGRPEVWRRTEAGPAKAASGGRGASGGSGGRPAGGGGPGTGEWERLHWPLKRALRALAYLASSPERRAPREEVVEALWPEHGADAVRRNFHPTLSHLRRGLRGSRGPAARGSEEPLVLQDGVYALAPELGWWIDLEELDRLLAVGRARAREGRDREAVAAWKEAWRLYRGEFLEGLDEPWAVRRREVHRRVYLGLLQELGAAHERLDRPQEAVDAYRALLVDDPLQEKIHLALMHLYGRQGRRDLVRRQYERLTALLRDELGVEPLPDTTRDYHRIMTQR